MKITPEEIVEIAEQRAHAYVESEEPNALERLGAEAEQWVEDRLEEWREKAEEEARERFEEEILEQQDQQEEE